MCFNIIIEMENVAVHVAVNRIDKDLLLEILTSIINDHQFSEELQIKILDSIDSEENEEDIENEPY